MGNENKKDDGTARDGASLSAPAGSAMCASCGQSPVFIPSDIYGLCEKCGNEYVQSLAEMNMEDESSHGLAT